MKVVAQGQSRPTPATEDKERLRRRIDHLQQRLSRGFHGQKAYPPIDTGRPARKAAITWATPRLKW
jgi:hypothetical protein